MSETKEIKCIVKTDRMNPHERIHAVGGTSAGSYWLMEQQEAIRAIENRKFDFYVNKGGKKVDVIVAVSRYGNKYLKTVADGETPNNLLALNACPV